MSAFIRLRSGGTLPRTVLDYDAGRPAAHGRSLRAFCYAPFLSMDFDAAGNISLCNHSHTIVAENSDDISVLDVWRGEVYRRFRDEMRGYVVDDENCRHCVRQCAAGPASHVFAVEQFDPWANDDPAPLYPKRLIFRLRNTCNLACLMCDGMTSSRIRAERDKLPPTPSRYGERFFRDMEEILPHVEHVEFYGGEPFLVAEHLRIFEILGRLNAQCTIYVNTNTVSLHAQAKRFLETLNFRTIAVSMDAVHAELHGEIRSGLKSDLFYRNFDYLLDLRARRGVSLMLNVTEHRKNWFELPEVFRFAERHQVYLHINTCIHPHNVTLYTLPTRQLEYVLEFLERQHWVLTAEFSRFSNERSYEFLLSLVRGELESRTPGWQPVLTNVNQDTDGLLAAPRPGFRPFETADEVAAEADRIVERLDPESAAHLLTELRDRLRTVPDTAAWHAVGAQIEGHLQLARNAAMPPAAARDPIASPMERPSVDVANPVFRSRLTGALKEHYFAGRVAADYLDTDAGITNLEDHIGRRYELAARYVVPWLQRSGDLSRSVVIEVGSGTGSCTLALAQSARHVECYEIHPGSVRVAQERLRFWGIDNVSVHARAFDEARVGLGPLVDAVVLYAALEHMTHDECLTVLRLGWQVLRPGGRLVIAETPNRFSMIDEHTSWLPFFSQLPRQIQVLYASRSPREEFRWAMDRAAESGSESAIEAMTRWGSGISFHEFELALGDDIHEKIVLDGYEPEITSIFQVTPIDLTLQSIFERFDVRAHRAFTRRHLYLVAVKP